MVKLGSGLCEYEPDKWSYYVYCPDGTLPILFSALFGISAVLHILQAWQYKNKYMGIYVVGCVLGCAGFAIRAVAARSGELQNLPYLIVSYVFIFSGPPIFAAGLYFIFARICYYVPAAAPITPYRIVRTFVSLDAICELLVGAGTGQFVNASNPKAQEIGQNILRAAIILQMILFLSFAYFAIRLQLNAKRLGIHGKWKMSLYTLYVCGFLILVRCGFRLVEFFEGFTGHLAREESYFYGFEAALMVSNTLYMNAMHVGRWLPRKTTIYLADDGVTELEGQGFHDNRPTWKKWSDPYDFEGIFLGLKHLVYKMMGKETADDDTKAMYKRKSQTQDGEVAVANSGPTGTAGSDNVPLTGVRRSNTGELEQGRK